MANRTTYESTDIVRYYRDYDVLQKPETALLESMRADLGSMRMLDAGVGAGRTVGFFAPLVKEYIGVDYSSAMVEACRTRFPDYTFEVRDIRSLEGFADNSFDFIMFSFNGIDYISHDDRMKALKEIRRVGVNGCVFFFSSHNLQSIDRLFRVRRTWHPLKLGYRLARYTLLKIVNGFSVRKLKQSGHSILNDGTHGFRLRTYYIKPIEQIRQLEENGFTHTHVYSVDTGEEITEQSELADMRDGWIYYRATVDKD